METLTQDVRALTTAIGVRRTPWGTIIGAITLGALLIGAIGASFVAPLTIVQQYHGKWLDKGMSVVETLQTQQAENTNKLASIDRRFDALEAAFQDVKVNGSSITRERLAVLEYEAFRRTPPTGATP